MEDDFQIENSLGFLVGRTYKVLAQKLNSNFAKAGYEVSLDHWIILSKLIHEGGQKQQHFSAVTGWDKTSITRIIDFMESRKWVYREADKSDRRIKLVYLTSQGRSLHTELMKIVKKTNYEMENELNQEDLATCKKVLKQLFEHAHHEY